jgi:hypothetical protein
VSVGVHRGPSRFPRARDIVHEGPGGTQPGRCGGSAGLGVCGGVQSRRGRKARDDAPQGIDAAASTPASVPRRAVGQTAAMDDPVVSGFNRGSLCLSHRQQ